MKHIPTYEEFLNESKVDTRLSTHEELKGVIARYRLSSSVVNLRSLVNLSKDPSVKFCTVFGPDEIGFEDATSRKKAMDFIKKSFDSGKLKLAEYELNEAKKSITQLATELVEIAAYYVEVDMTPEMNQAQSIEDEDELIEFMEELYDTVAEDAGTAAGKFKKEATAFLKKYGVKI